MLIGVLSQKELRACLNQYHTRCKFPYYVSNSIKFSETTFQRQFNVEITLIRRWKWNKIRCWSFNVKQRWYNVGVWHLNNVEATLSNVVRKLCLRCFNVASMLLQLDSNQLSYWSVWICKQINHFYSASRGNIFFSVLAFQLLTMAYVITHLGNKGDIHRSLKYCDFKTPKHHRKM